MNSTSHRSCLTHAAAKAVTALLEGLEPRRLFAAFDPPFLGLDTTAHGVIEQADGKVIVVGSTDVRGDGNSDFLIVRFDVDGALDASFGVGGVTLTDVSGGGGADVAYGLFVGRNGKIIVVGSADESGETEAAVARYNPDGTLDTTFSGDGIRTTGYAGREDVAYDVLIDSAGRLVFVGASGGDFLIGRLRIDGTNDSSFNRDGLDLAGFGGAEAARGVALLPGGQIVAGGFTTNGIGGSDFAATLYDPRTGNRVTAFGADGKLTVDIDGRSDVAWGVAVDTKGRIVLGGTTSIPAVAAVRLNPSDGTLDTSFGGTGIDINFLDILPGIPSQQQPPTGGGVFTSASDKVNFAGAWRDARHPLPRWHVARVPSWGGREHDQWSVYPTAALAAIAPTRNDLWLIAGEDFTVRRTPETATEPTFGSDGFASLPIVLGSDGVLVARGTVGGDVIDIRRAGIDDVIVTVNGLSRRFDIDDFSAVRLEGAGGDDVITVIDPVTAGSLARDVTLDGGNGNDLLTGNGGNDYFWGWEGDDTLIGLGGRDMLFGNGGNDLLFGGEDDDSVNGGDGNDHLEGAAGADTLIGHTGNDSLFGGVGADLLDGGDGDDFLKAREGAPADTVDGGDGTDTANTDPGDARMNVEVFA